ncbi:MAG: hypothetical protein R3E46_04255 [Sedimenticolaceae bacterium]
MITKVWWEPGDLMGVTKLLGVFTSYESAKAVIPLYRLWLIENHPGGGDNAARIDRGKFRVKRLTKKEVNNLSEDQIARIHLGDNSWPPSQKFDNSKMGWPKSLADQVQAVCLVLEDQSTPLTSEQIARQFEYAQTRRVEEVLEALVGLSIVSRGDEGRYSAWQPHHRMVPRYPLASDTHADLPTVPVT